jgi:hypothetical protein
MSEPNYQKLSKALQYCGYIEDYTEKVKDKMTVDTLSLDDADPWGSRKDDVDKIKEENDKKDSWKTADEFRSAASSIKNGNYI